MHTQILGFLTALIILFGQSSHAATIICGKVASQNESKGKGYVMDLSEKEPSLDFFVKGKDLQGNKQEMLFTVSGNQVTPVLQMISAAVQNNTNICVQYYFIGIPYLIFN